MSAADDSSSRPRSVVIDGTRAVVWTDAEGTVRAARDQCPHRRAPLSAGTVDDGILRCPYHGWSFNGSGRCTLLPAIGPEGRIPNRARLELLDLPDTLDTAGPIGEGSPCRAPSVDLLDADTPGLDRFWHPVARRRELADGAIDVELLGERWAIRPGPDGLVATSSAGELAWGVEQHLHHVWLAPSEPLAPLPDVPEWGEEGWYHQELSRAEGRYGAGLLVDNQLDAAHFSFVHAGTFGSPEGAYVSPVDVVTTPTGARCTMRIAIRAANDHRAPADAEPDAQHRVMTYQWEAPLWLRLRLDYEGMGGSTLILFAVTPQAVGRARMDVDLFFAHPDGFTDEQLATRLAFEERVVGEDLALQRAFEDLKLPLEPTRELHTRADRLSVQFRQVLRDLLQRAARLDAT